jgi:hypothetical protein
VAPSAPSFVGGTNTLTVPAKTGVTYELNGVAQAAGDVVITEDTEVTADANEGFYIAPNTTRSWTFTFTA